jgi:predicted nucleic acid-binding protein
MTLSVVDGLLIAATALHHELTVVTRNVKTLPVWAQAFSTRGSR